MFRQTLLNHPIPDRVGRGLEAIADVQLREEVRDVIANRVRADEKLLSNLGVALPACEQLQDLDLARGQVLEEKLLRRCAATRPRRRP